MCLTQINATIVGDPIFWYSLKAIDNSTSHGVLNVLLFAILKRVAWYFEFRRGWCGTLKRVVWYFEEDCVVL